MARLPLIGTLLALLAAAFAIFWLLRAGPLVGEPVLVATVEPPPTEKRMAGLEEAPVQGGVYAGRVVDTADRPIHGARVMLVEYDAGDAALKYQQLEDHEEGFIPQIGALRPGGEAITDEDGRFRIAADAQARIRHVLAHHINHFLDVAHVHRPRDDIVLRLQKGGRVIGTVVDHETGHAVPGAVIDVYLQQKVGAMPDLPEGAKYPVVKRKKHKVSWIATLGRFLPEFLGPRIWEIPFTSKESLRLVSDANGHFEIGPLGNAVQLEFVVTHKKYMWYDFDTEGGKKYARRTVVEPGETVRREFRLREGKFVAGQVIDDQGKGIENVLVEVQSISAYYRHPFYRHKWRRTLTGEDGKFRVEGLARGSQQLLLKHETFGTKVETAEADTDNLVIVADPFGGLEGTLQGVPRGTEGRTVQVMVESTEENPRHSRRKGYAARLDKNSVFTVNALRPGKYRVWVKAAGESTQPVDVEIRAHETTQADFELGGGGVLEMRVLDKSGAIIDPASVRLIAIMDGRERALGTFASREGKLSVDGVAPGTYRLRVQASGRIPLLTDVFEIRDGRSTILPPAQLREWGYIRIGQPVDETGRPARLAANAIIELRQGKEPFRRVLVSAGADIAVKPGPLDIRARSGESQFAQTVQVEDGKTHNVRVVFESRR